MSRTETSHLLLLVVVQLVLSETLMDRFTMKHKDPNDHIIEKNAFLHQMEGIFRPKPLSEVGTFRGRPIIARQWGTFVDKSGSVISILPYNDNSRRINSRPNRYHQL